MRVHCRTQALSTGFAFAASAGFCMAPSANGAWLRWFAVTRSIIGSSASACSSACTPSGSRTWMRSTRATPLICSISSKRWLPATARAVRGVRALCRRTARSAPP